MEKAGVSVGIHANEALEGAKVVKRATDSVISDVNRMEKEVDSANASVAKMGDSAKSPATALAALEKNTRAAGAGTTALERAAEHAKVSVEQFGNMSKASQDRIMAFSKAANDAKTQTENLADMAADASSGVDALGEGAKQAADGTETLGEASKDAEGKVKDLADESNRLSDIWKKSKGLILIAALVAVGAALAKAGVEAFKFQQEMRKVQGVLNKDYDGNIKDLSKTVKELSAEFGTDTASQAEALYSTIKEGAKSAEESTELLTQANKLAIATVTDLEVVTAGLASTMDDYGQSVDYAESVSDSFFTAASLGTSTIEELLSGMESLAPIAAKAGIDLDSLLAATVGLTNAGEPTSRAMGAVADVIRSIIDPSTEAFDAAEALGITLSAAGMAAAGGFIPFMEDVIVATEGSGAAMQDILPNIQNADTAFALASISAGELTAAYTELNQKSGSTEAAFAAVSEEAGFLFTVLSSKLGKAVKDLGDFTLVLAGPLIGPLIDAVDWLSGAFESLAVGADNLFTIIKEGRVLTTLADEFLEINGVMDLVILALMGSAGLVAALYTLNAALAAAKAAAIAFEFAFAALPFVLGAVEVAAKLATGGFEALTVSIKANTAALLANPWGAAAVLITTAVTALYLYRDSMVEIGDTTARIGALIQASWEMTVEHITSKFEGLFAFLDVDLNYLAAHFSEVWDGMLEDVSQFWDDSVAEVEASVNFIAGLFDFIGKALGIQAAHWVKVFVNFGKDAKTLMTATWEDVLAVFTGDFDFSNLSEALENGLTAPIPGIAEELEALANSIVEKDYVGLLGQKVAPIVEELGLAVDDFNAGLVSFGETIAERAVLLDTLKNSTDLAATATENLTLATDIANSPFALYQTNLSNLEGMLSELASSSGGFASATESQVAQLNKWRAALAPAAEMMDRNTKARKLLNDMVRDGTLAESEYDRLVKQMAVSLKTYEERLANVDKSLTMVTRETQAAVKVNADLAKSWETLEKELNPVKAITEEYGKKIQLVKDAVVLFGLESDIAAEYIAQLTEEMEEALEAAGGLEGGLQDLVDGLDPLGVLTKEYNEDVKELIENQGLLESKGYDVGALLVQLERNYKDNTIAAQKNMDTAYPWGAAWEQAIQRVDDAFFNLWKSAFEGTDSFLDSLEDALKTFAAQTLHNIFTQPLVNAIAAFGNDALAAASGAAAGGAGADYGVYSGLASYGTSVYSGLQNGEGFGALSPEWLDRSISGYESGGFSGAWDNLVGNTPDTSGIEAAIALENANGPFGTGTSLSTGAAGTLDSYGNIMYDGYAPPVPQTPASGVTVYDASGNVVPNGGMEVAPTGINWASIGASIVGGMVGAYAGQEIFDNEGSTGVGAGVGGIVGGYLGSAVGGPWGAGAGAALGSFAGEGFEKLLGDVFGFGGKPGNNWGRADFDLATGEVSDPYGIGKWSKENGDNSVMLVDAMQQFADVIGGSDLEGTVSISDRRGIRGPNDVGDYKDSGRFFDEITDEILMFSTELDDRLKPFLLRFEGSVDEHINFAAELLDVYGDISDTELPKYLHDLGTSLNLAEDRTGEYSISVASMLGLVHDGRTATEKLTEAYEENAEAADDISRALEIDMVEAFNEVSDRVDRLILNFNHTTDSAVELNKAMEEQQITLIAYTALILDLKEGITASIEALRNPFTDLFGDTDYLTSLEEMSSEAQSIFDDIATMADANSVGIAVDEILGLWDSVYASMADSLSEIKDTADSVRETLAGTINGFIEDTLSTDELTEKLETDLQALADKIPTLTDPVQIADTVDQINELTQQLWGLIPEDQRLENLDQFVTFLEEVDAAVQAVLGNAAQDILEAGGVSVTDEDSIDTMIASLLTGYAEQLTLLEDASNTKLDSILTAMEERNRETLDAAGATLTDAADKNEYAATLMVQASESLVQSAAVISEGLNNISVNVNLSDSGALAA